MTKKGDVPRRIVVVGASLAGLNALQAARREGYEGELVLVGAERHRPYDRPPLSKALLEATDGASEPAAPHFPGVHTLEADLRVDLRLGAPATALDPTRKRVTVGRAEVAYDALILATGVYARTLPATAHLSGVHTLRSLDDATRLRISLAKGTHVVVIGAGFIGSEVASMARKRGLEVTILEAQPTPLARVLGGRAGAALTELHRRQGTRVECGVKVEALEEEAGAVTAVRLADGRRFPANVVLVGIGAVPATEWLEGSGLTLDDGVVCDETLFAGAEGVWAAGDVARWPNVAVGSSGSGGRVGPLTRVEHWTNAVDQGIHAMGNALRPSEATAYRTTPYFWSDWYDSVIQFAGVATGEATLVAGSWDGPTFTALYADGPAFAGVLTLNGRADVMKFRGLLTRGASFADALAFAESRRRAAPSAQ